MSQQIITGGNGISGQTGEQVKDIINENFTELYDKDRQIWTEKISGVEDLLFRSDGPSVLVLDSGEILVAFHGYYTEEVEDEGAATIFTVRSSDGGRSFNSPVKQFDSIGAVGTYLPSLYQRDNGSVFMLVYVNPTLITSEIWKVESSDGG